MADDLKYGYKGADVPQSFGNNKGVFDPADINNLVKDDKWTNYGQLELIETQTVTSGQVMDFTSIQESTYNVHFLAIQGIGGGAEVSSTHTKIRFFVNGTLRTGNVYQYAYQYNWANGTNGENKSTTSTNIPSGTEVFDNANDGAGSYVYLYNLGDSAKYSFATYQGVQTVLGVQRGYFGSGVLTQENTVDGIRLYSANSIDYISLQASLYGIKEYS